MPKTVSRALVVALPLLSAMSAAAAWTGCSDDPAAPAAEDAGPDRYVPPIDGGPPPGPDAADAKPPGRDCTADEAADGIVNHLECTGLYDDFAGKAVAAANKPYKPAAEFWSDGAEKSRYLFLPPGAKIDITDFDEWSFPNGTKVWKEFRLGGKRIETRLYFKSKDSWRHTSYRWNDTESDAVRKDEGELVAQAGGAPYEIPNTGQCDTCHAGRKEPILGLDAIGLGLSGATGITLASLAAEGRFSKTPPVTALTIPNNAGGAAAPPALAWLHANCGSCHNKNDNAGAQFTNLFFLLRPSQLVPDGGAPTVESLDSYATAVGVESTKVIDDAGVPFVRIVKGDPDASLSAIYSGRRVPVGMPPDPSQMPPIVTRRVDVAGHKLFTDWITVIP